MTLGRWAPNRDTLDEMRIPVPEKHIFSLRCTFGLRTGEVLQGKTLGREDVTVQCAALKYPVSESGQGLTLVLTHGLSSHKESYHPTVAHLLRLNASGTRSANWIREIWLIDMPNHGESAALNRAYLEDRQERGRKEGWDGRCDTMDISTYLNAFLSIKQLQNHMVVGIAHSGSCTAWTHALTLLDRTHPHPFALVFIEPTLIFPGLPPTDFRMIHGAANVRGVLAKRDKWSNRAEAKRWLLGTKNGDPEDLPGKQRGGGSLGRPESQSYLGKNANQTGNGDAGRTTVWSKWDDRVLDLFVEHALEEVRELAPSPPELTESSSYVRSILRKEEESSLYACPQHTVEPAQLARMCAALSPGSRKGPVPGNRGMGGVHILWAEVEDYTPKPARAELLDGMSHGVLSQRVVPDAGHLIPQENPSGLADALYDVLVSHIAVAAGLTVRASL
ncbi:Alpha/beta hydrolase family-domain-containing protein [Pisolithus albus]|nr:Alpha/beta hydrolase family-domain-containing protein [Pisolithus albus]